MHRLARSKRVAEEPSSTSAGSTETASPIASRGSDGSLELETSATAAPPAGVLQAAGAGTPPPAAATPAAAPGSAGTTMPLTVEDQFLCIRIREARNLVGKNFETHSSDPFVKVTLGGMVRKTRTIYRNRHPMWQQRLLFPLDQVSEGTPLLLEVWDKEFHKVEFLGQVLMTVGKALQLAQDVQLGDNFWIALGKKRSTDIITGEICLGFEVLDPFAYAEAVKEVEDALDPECIQTKLSKRALHVQLQGLNGLRASGLSAVAAAAGLTSTASGGTGAAGGPGSLKLGRGGKQQLRLFIRFGRFWVEKPLQEHLLSEEGAVDFEVAINEEVLIPLESAMKFSPLIARRKDELYDVKVYIKGADTIAKTQIPIWDIPTEEDDLLGPNPAAAAAAEVSSKETGTGEAADAEASALAGAAGASAAAGAGAGGGAADASAAAQQASSAAGNASASASSAPGGAASDRSACSSPSGSSHLDAVFKATTRILSLRPKARTAGVEASEPSMTGLPVTRVASELLVTPSLSVKPSLPNSSQLSTVDLVPRSSKSEAHLTRPLLDRGSPGNSSTASASSSRAGSPLPGSLQASSAATAAGALSRPVSPAALAAAAAAAGGGKAKKQVPQDHLSRAFRSMLIPAKEVSRMGWVRLRSSAEEGELPCDPMGKRYVRILENYLNLPSNLEIGLGLRLVRVPEAAAGLAALATTSNMPESVVMDEDDDEDVPDAVPLPPPEALDAVILDTTLPLGVNNLYRHLFGAGSAFMQNFQAGEKLSDVSCGAWVSDAAGRVRQVSYIKPLRIPLPLAPKQCKVWEEQRIVTKENGGFVAEVRCTNDAPKGDCFVAIVQLYAATQGTVQSRFRVTMKLDWHKNTLGKSMVQGGAESDSKRSWNTIATLLRQRAAAAGTSTSKLADVVAAGSAVGGDGSGQRAVDGAVGGPSTWQVLLLGGGGAWPLMLLALQLLLVVLLLVLVAGVWRVGSDVRSSMKDVAAAIREAGAAAAAAAAAAAGGRAGATGNAAPQMLGAAPDAGAGACTCV